MQSITIQKASAPIQTVYAMQPITKNLFNSWLEFIDVKPKTAETYKKAVKQFLLYLESIKEQLPERQTIIDFRNHIAKSRKPSTANTYLMAVKQFFKWTEIEKIYPNIAVNVKSLKIGKGFKKDSLTSEQAKEMLENIDRTAEQGKRDYALLSLILTSGLRTIEIERAKVGDIRNVGNQPVLFIQGKGRDDKNEYIKLVPEVEKAIRIYLRTRKGLSNESPLFSSVSNRGKENGLTTRSIRRIAKNRMIEIDLDSPRLTAHSLRHTTATLNLLAGGTLEETRQLLRHSSLDTTLIYAHNLERAKNNSEQRVAQQLF